MTIEEKALKFAINAHKGQVRKSEPDKPMIFHSIDVGRKLKEYGILCDGKVAKQITKEDYEKFDYIICMDNNNLRNIRYVVGEDTYNKISARSYFIALILRKVK